MFKQFESLQLNVDGQDDDNSSFTAPLDQSTSQYSFDPYSQYWFDPFGQIGAYPLSFSYPSLYGYVTDSVANFSWGTGSTSPPGLASAGSASPSARVDSASSPGVSAVSGSSPDALAPTANASTSSSSGSSSSVVSAPDGLAPTANASSSASSGSSSSVVSTPGSGLVFDNTYTASCTAAFEGCIVAAEDQFESLFTNSVTLNITFQEQNSGNNGVALGNSWPSSYNVSYATLKAHLPSTDDLPATDPDPAG